MSLPLYLSALKLSRNSFITWAIILLAYAFLLAYLYENFKDMAGLKETMESMPEGLQAAMGTSGLDFDAFAGGVWDVRIYINTEYLTWVPLMLAIYAVFYCGGIVSREAERGTLDLLLSQPLARYRLLLSKMGTFASMIAVLLAVSWVGAILGFALTGVEIDPGRLLLAHVVILPVVIAVAGYCALISCLYLDPRLSLALAGVITAAMYLLHILAPLMGGLRWLGNLSLFHHIDLLPILLYGSINWTGMAVNLLVAAVMLAAALAVFERRDLSY